ncbi:esterase family protein [Rhodococcus sp. MTM3W5.2]|uniref:alpha/beta hydrolase n=1 Tax=Rhodococcus sp. MTM3W5.2 TaxID=1805827 RepID=UPI0009791284|nr:alpha/beta hydrolase family protein [Rhodococcus sp. MTM3W5.2]AQA20799.1 esterase family protein [Rhodococcus sp. MTM3W5.2]
MRPQTSRRGRLVAAAIALTVLPMLVSPALAPAAPATAQSESGSKLERIEKNSDRKVTAYVYSAAMDQVIPVEVITPADTSAPRPTLYLLNGAGGGEDRATWQKQTDVMSFFADKNVNVVTPIGGAFSYYTDWQQDDPKLGRNKWTTFLTKELPPIIDDAFDTTGVNSIAGISMAGTSVLNLAIAAPQLYKSVGAYSGCAETSTDAGKFYVRTVVESRGGAEATNMWGPYDGPGWAENDPVVNAEKLRGIQLFVSSSTGLPGDHDNLANPAVNGRVDTLANQVIVGGMIEAAVNQCTHNLQGRLGQLGIPATFDFRPAGTHSWGYWQDDLHESWPMLAQSIGL